MLDFKVIQVHLPGKNKDSKKAEGQFIFYKLPVIDKETRKLWFFTEGPIRHLR